MNRRNFLNDAVRLVLAGTLSPRLARAEEPLSSPYLDAHVHPLSPALLAYRRAGSSGKGPAEGPVTGDVLVARMDAEGVHRAFVLSTAYQMAADAYRTTPVSESEERVRVAAENDFAAAECARFPDRLVPFLSVNPKRSYAVEEIDRCVEVNRMRGLKLHLWNSMVDTRQDADLRALITVVSHAARRGLPVVAHIFVGAVPAYGAADTARFVREVIAPAETLKISLAHLAGAGGFGSQEQDCFAQLIDSCGPGTPLAPRVWTDMAAVLSSSTPPAAVDAFAQLVPRWGYERLFWGSDSLVDALPDLRDRWPLVIAGWRIVASNRGTAFVA